jgi:hypothetical protein
VTSQLAPGQQWWPGKGHQKRRALIIGAYVAAAAAFTAVGFGATSVIRGQLGSASAASAIPTPPPANQTFVEDDDGTGADSQENILQSTVPGLARITSAHGSGSGVVLTQHRRGHDHRRPPDHRPDDDLGPGVRGAERGRPVVNLSGQVVGIDLSGSAHGADVTSYAVPMNQALRVAQQLKH